MASRWPLSSWTKRTGRQGHAKRRRGAGTRKRRYPPRTGTVHLHGNGPGVFRHLDRQHPADHPDARHLLGMGQGPADAVLLRQHPSRGRQLRLSRAARADPDRPDRRRRHAGALQRHAGVPAACRRHHRRRVPVRGALSRHARTALFGARHELPQRAVRFRRRLWRRLPGLPARRNPGLGHAGYPRADRVAMDVELHAWKPALWRPAGELRPAAGEALRAVRDAGHGLRRRVDRRRRHHCGDRHVRRSLSRRAFRL